MPGAEPPRNFPGETGGGGEGAEAGGDTAPVSSEGPSAEAGQPKSEPSEGSSRTAAAPAQVQPSAGYPLATVVIVALIAFLIGSLLRSLLSPADFIYVVSDMKEAKKVSVAGTGGWREIRRLLEIKYILGGWDFQIAAVRRHM